MKGGNALAGDCLNGAGKFAPWFDEKFVAAAGSGSAVNGDNSSAVSG